MTATLTTVQKGIDVSGSPTWADRLVWGASFLGLAIWGASSAMTSIGHSLDKAAVEANLGMYKQAAIEAVSNPAASKGQVKSPETSEPRPAAKIFVDGKEVGSLSPVSRGDKRPEIKDNIQWVVANAIDASDKTFPQVCVKEVGQPTKCIGFESQVGAWFDTMFSGLNKAFYTQLKDIDWSFFGASTSKAPEKKLYAQAAPPEGNEPL